LNAQVLIDKNVLMSILNLVVILKFHSWQYSTNVFYEKLFIVILNSAAAFLNFKAWQHFFCFSSTKASKKEANEWKYLNRLVVASMVILVDYLFLLFQIGEFPYFVIFKIFLRSKVNYFFMVFIFNLVLGP
jgi:hypothetical protein